MSVRTIFNRRQAFEMPTSSDAYTALTDNDLDALVTEIVSMSDRIGERMVMGGLRSRGIRVQYRRLRQSWQRVDPIGRAMRRRRLINKRVYSVPASNCLWYSYCNSLLFLTIILFVSQGILMATINWWSRGELLFTEVSTDTLG